MHTRIHSHVSTRRGTCPDPAGRARGFRQGFTIVELLVVIAIITTLGAISMAVYIKAKNSGDNSAAISNMEQIGKAIFDYQNDHGGHLPAFQDTGVSPKYSTGEPYTQASVLRHQLKLPKMTSKTQYAEIFHPPGLKGELLNGRKNWYDLTCYAMYNADYFIASKAYLPKGSVTDADGKDLGPFGPIAKGADTTSDESDTSDAEGWTNDQVNAARDKFAAEHNNQLVTNSMVPMMLEINAQYPSKGGWPWAVPKKPLTEGHINVLYFDGCVRSKSPTFFFKE